MDITLDLNSTFRNRDWLYNEFVTLNKTYKQVSEEYGVAKWEISNFLEKSGLYIMQERILAGKKGKKVTPETCEKMSASRIGDKNPSFGKSPSIETREKMSLKRRGKPLSIKTCTKMSEARMREKNPRWLGGISFEPYCPKFDKDLRRRVRAYFGNQCVLCGKSSKQNKKNLSVHHVSYNKNACCDGKRVQFAALCQSCHSKTGAKRENWEEMLHIIIYEIYNDRSYFTKEEWKDIYI
jgi:hypothetical protein